MLTRNQSYVLSCVSLQLANVLSSEALFYTCIIPFICFFGAFAFVFYPLRDVLHPTGAHTDLFTRPSRTQQQQQRWLSWGSSWLVL